MIPFTRRRGGPEWYQDKRVIKAAACLSGCAVITLCCGRFETVPYSNRRHFIVLPPLAEGFLGKCFFARSKIELASKILPPEHPDSVRVRKITMDIVRAAERGLAGHLDRLDWEVIVVKDKLVNASCLPGGKIIVYTGLLEQMEMDAEVATVLGHEVGHAIARHVAENITKFMWFVVLKIVFLQFIDLEEEDELIDGMWKVLFQLPFSRRNEITQVLPEIRGAQLYGFLDGSAVEPEKTLKTKDMEGAEVTIPNPEHARWIAQDQTVLGFLVRNMAKEVLTQMVGLPTSAAVWKAVVEMFSAQSQSRVVHLRTK
ncbi:mitochondrial metalloendopeptidase OMA1-like [Lolium perenne]|uniref:mitochondrial metalloendopeptidase OMA1-like n=1 Tax=Lolium perenne TaxID=4522 RepID=UPI0021F69993|nr:mitochondrial metalloendopeptidase OMA1-like [Lolium perenne]